MAVECVVDWVGVALAGSAQDVAALVAPLFDGAVDAVPRRGASTVLRAGLDKFSGMWMWASFLNGFNGHVLGLDHVHRSTLLHPGAAVIPAALACAERYRASGSRLLAAIVVGYEVCSRVAEAAGRSHHARWDTTGTCGAFGAAAAAGKVLGLDDVEMCWALGHAGAHASGLRQVREDGAISRPLYAAKAALTGLLAALMAKCGFGGPVRILEGEQGFLKTMSSEPALEALTDRLGERYRICEVSMKPYPSCKHSHAQVDAALEIAAEPGFDPDRVRAVRVRTYETAVKAAITSTGGGGKYPRSPSEAFRSSPYCVAVALQKGRLGLRDFRPDAIRLNDYARRLIPNTTLEVDDELDAEYPKMCGAEVEVTMDDGATLSSSVMRPKGDPENPMSLEEVCDKAVDLAEIALPHEQAVACVQQVADVQNAKDVAVLLDV
jgi:2-methylcitrate dehydratase PrpD